MPAHTLRALCAWILVLAMTLGPKSIIQISAWALMFQESAAQSSIEEAFAETFSGASPCSLCKSLAAEPETQDVAISSKTDSSLKGFKCIEFENTFAKPPAESAVVLSFEYALGTPEEPTLSKATPPPKFS